MKFPWSDMTGYPRALTIFATILLISGGLCGLQFTTGDKIHVSGAPELLIISGMLELIAIFVSAVGIVVVLIVWAISSISNGLSKPSNDDDATGDSYMDHKSVSLTNREEFDDN